jgi:hypothetical protein
VNQIVYNAFIAPFYTLLAAFGSLILLNAILFLISTILIHINLCIFPPFCSISNLHSYNFLIEFFPVFCSLINSLLIALMDQKNGGGSLFQFCGLPMAICIGSSSFGILSIYWPLQSIILSVPFGALIGLNIFLIFDRTLLDGLIKEFANKIIQF